MSATDTYTIGERVEVSRGPLVYDCVVDRITPQLVVSYSTPEGRVSMTPWPETVRRAS